MTRQPLSHAALALLVALAAGLPTWAETADAANAPNAADPAWDRAAKTEIRAFTEPDADPAELSEELRGAAAIFLGVAEAPGGDPNGYWRAARAEWLSGELLPLGDDDAKLERFERAKSLAQRGIDANPDCGECMMWKFSAMARVATTRGLLSAVRQAREMGELLDRGIELQPTHDDGPGSSTLGNLYYASAVFHRVVPEWTWLEWFFGVKGDLDRSLEMIRDAVDLAPDRIDYLVEYGAVLQCYGQRRDESWAGAEAARVLGRATRLEPHIGTDTIDQGHARTLMADPSKACGYSRDGWIDTSRRAAAEARKG